MTKQIKRSRLEKTIRVLGWLHKPRFYFGHQSALFRINGIDNAEYNHRMLGSEAPEALWGVKSQRRGSKQLASGDSLVRSPERIR